MALVSLLKCWPGIFCLCNQHNLGMTSLLNMLPLAKPNVQREILDVLYGVFQLEVPEWSTSYNDALASIGKPWVCQVGRILFSWVLLRVLKLESNHCFTSDSLRLKNF